MVTNPEVTPGNDPNDPDTEGSTVPPYEGRRESADVDESGATKDDAYVGGATGPVADDALKADEPADTDRGAVASPADEQPAAESTDTDMDPDMVGPDHYKGTGRGEDEGA